MDTQLILGSKSPRRKQILEQAGLDFKIMFSDEEEIIPSHIPLEKIPEFLAIQKATYILPKIIEKDYILLTVDTIVLLHDKIISKPKDKMDAIQILRTLSGKVHQVLTGVCLTTKSSRIVFTEETKVAFKQLTDEEIKYYVENYEVMDKAGAYAIQEWIGMIGIPYIQGSYYNVMGLPIHRVYQEIKKLIDEQKVLHGEGSVQ